MSNLKISLTLENLFDISKISIARRTIFWKEVCKQVLNQFNGVYRINMDSGTNFPSCIKIPPTNSKQGRSTMLSQRFDVKDALAVNNELILLANRRLGEGKWSHTVTNQAIDFVEAFMGKYVCGCVTFVKIQLQNGTFHEDMGYCHAEGAMKGFAIHCARIGSLIDAFKKVLICFDNEIGNEIQTSKKLSYSHMPINQKEDLHCSVFNVPGDLLEPCAQSTPLVARKNDELIENAPRSKSPNELRGQIPVAQTRARSKSPIVKLNGTGNQKGPDNIQTEQESKKVLTEEEFLRMERKRRQMEKQAEFKRQMKEKEQQKFNEPKKVNPKY